MASMRPPTIRFVNMGTDWRSKKVIRLPHTKISTDIEQFLSKPTWSVRSLLPKPPGETDSKTKPEPEITREKLHHLLRLSALPLPKDELEEKKMMETLEAQIHFVKEVQKVDTTGVEPLVAIRDETDDAKRMETITLADVQQYLDKEEKIGKNGTVRRRKEPVLDDKKSEDWMFNLGDDAESRRMGRYFYVKRKREDLKQENISQSIAPG